MYFTREIMLRTLIVPRLNESILQPCSIMQQFSSYSRIACHDNIHIYAGDSVRLLNRNDFCALDFDAAHGKMEIYGSMDKISGHSPPIENGRFNTLSSSSLEVAESVRHSCKSLIHAPGRITPFLETMEIVYFKAWPSDYSNIHFLPRLENFAASSCQSQGS